MEGDTEGSVAFTTFIEMFKKEDNSSEKEIVHCFLRLCWLPS
jgi:hypothetical protein